MFFLVSIVGMSEIGRRQYSKRPERSERDNSERVANAIATPEGYARMSRRLWNMAIRGGDLIVLPTKEFTPQEMNERYAQLRANTLGARSELASVLYPFKVRGVQIEDASKAPEVREAVVAYNVVAQDALSESIFWAQENQDSIPLQLFVRESRDPQLAQNVLEQIHTRHGGSQPDWIIPSISVPVGTHERALQLQVYSQNRLLNSIGKPTGLMKGILGEFSTSGHGTAVDRVIESLEAIAALEPVPQQILQT